MCWPARWWWAPCWCGSRPSNWSIAEVKLSVPLSTPYLFQTSKRNLHMSTIGFIGLGAMGSGMAASLRRAGHELQVFDVRREVADAFAAQGGRACGSPAEAAKGADVVVSVVVNAAQTEAVLFGADGQGGCAQAMSPGAVFVMCSTVDPNWSAALETRLEALGLGYLDAPISGGAAKAASGQMTMMTAGRPAVYDKVGPCSTPWPPRSTAWVSAPAPAARSRSSTSCWPACTSPLLLKPWPWACAKASRARPCTR